MGKTELAVLIEDLMDRGYKVRWRGWPFEEQTKLDGF